MVPNGVGQLREFYERKLKSLPFGSLKRFLFNKTLYVDGL